MHDYICVYVRVSCFCFVLFFFCLFFFVVFYVFFFFLVKGPKRVVHAAQTSELAHEEHGGEYDHEEFDHDQALRYALVDYYYGYAEETLGEESYSEYV